MAAQRKGPPTINDELAELIEGGVILVLATSDDTLTPHLTRAWAAQLTEDRTGLSVLVPTAQAHQCLADLEKRSNVSVSACRASTYDAVQLKGRVVDRGPAEAKDALRLDRFWSLLFEDVGKVGVPADLARAMDSEGHIHLTIALDDIFDQRPGPGAGRGWKP